MVTFKSELIFSTQTIKGKSHIDIPTDHTFFGVDLEYKGKTHKQIFDFLYRSNGGFTYQDVYTMPISIRNMYIKFLNDSIEKQNAETKKAGRSRKR